MRDLLPGDYGQPLTAMVSTRSGRRNAKVVTRNKNITGRKRSKTTVRPKTAHTSSAKSVEDAKTMGEAIQVADSIEDHLYISEKWVWLPSDADLPPHLRHQLVSSPFDCVPGQYCRLSYPP